MGALVCIICQTECLANCLPTNNPEYGLHLDCWHGKPRKATAKNRLLTFLEIVETHVPLNVRGRATIDVKGGASYTVETFAAACEPSQRFRVTQPPEAARLAGGNVEMPMTAMAFADATADYWLWWMTTGNGA